jgi:hypothetical protein
MTVPFTVKYHGSPSNGPALTIAFRLVELHLVEPLSPGFVSARVTVQAREGKDSAAALTCEVHKKFAYSYMYLAVHDEFAKLWRKKGRCAQVTPNSWQWQGTTVT